MGLNPLVMENATFGWSKLLTVAYVLLGTWFYCRFIEKREPLTLQFAFAALSVGVLTHYSAGPYVVLLAGHYLWHRLTKPNWKEIAVLVAVNVLILSTWFGWSMARYGRHVTFGSNPNAALDVQHGPGEAFKTVTGNLRNTLIPPFLRADNPARGLKFSMPALHDYSFLVYETNLLLAVGSVGWFIALLAAGKLAWRAKAKQLLHFWVWFVVGAVLLGVGLLGERNPWGLAHLDLQPLILLGLVLVASAWSTLSKPLRLLLVLGLGWDFAVGVLLHFAYEHWYAAVLTASYVNWRLKQDQQLTFIGDGWPALLFIAEALLLALILYRFYQQRTIALEA